MLRGFLFQLVILFALAGPAFGQQVILMVNMNYSSEELKALEEVAAARGQRVEMVPPRDLIATAEPMFLKKYQLQGELTRKLSPAGPADDKTVMRIKMAMNGISREGASWRGDPELLSMMGSARISEIHQAAQKIFAAEQRNGDLVEQLKRKAAELKAKGDRVDSVVFSSHADGSNLTGETTNRLSANELSRLKQEQPFLFDSARHVLLLGCYNMTKPNHRSWRYDLFPNASMLAGFGVKAPSRFDQKSSNFIRQTMGTADKLDREMAGAGRLLDARYLDKVFKSLNTFTTTNHPGVIDYCGAISEGQPETFTRDCDTQWADIYEKKRLLEDYWSLIAPREDPPTVSGGALRTFYNALQAACPATETPSERAYARDAERFRVTMREHTIRLIFWWNVQSNFSTYYKGEIESMNARLRSAGLWEMPRLDGSTSRVRFVSEFNLISRELGRSHPSLRADFERLYGPLFYLKGEDTVAAGERISVEQTLARNAIPFNWIEGSTVMRRR
jgi:hypothetical protein